LDANRVGNLCELILCVVLYTKKGWANKRISMGGWTVVNFIGLSSKKDIL
jgi:hypothetical protein